MASMNSTNYIRGFADKVRAASSTNRDVVLSQLEARNLNHEIQQLLARLVELQDLAEVGRVEVEMKSNKF